MTVVFKLGGSLLMLPGLVDRLRAAISQRSGEKCLIVMGGGTTADVVREWSRIHDLTAENAHWLAVASIDFNGQLLSRLLNWKSVHSRTMAREYWLTETDPLILEMSRFAAEEEAKDESDRTRSMNPLAEKADPADVRVGDGCSSIGIHSMPWKRERLPHNWDVTSDSLAAWTTIQWPADELVLLKSVPTPFGSTAQEASVQQLVDPHFPAVADQVLRIGWCNLRAPTVYIEHWLPNHHVKNG